MKLFKMLTLGLILALALSCGNKTTDTGSGGGSSGGGAKPDLPIPLDEAAIVFATRLGDNKRLVISTGEISLANTKALISANGKTITATEANGLGGNHVAGQIFNLVSVVVPEPEVKAGEPTTPTPHTAIYAVGRVSDPATDLVLTFTDVTSSDLKLAETDASKVGTGDTAVNAKLYTANALIASIMKQNVLRLSDEQDATVLTNPFSNVGATRITTAGGKDEYFGVDSNGDATYTTVLSYEKTDVIKAVITITSDDVNKKLARNTITIPNLSANNLSTEDAGITLSKDDNTDSVAVVIAGT